MTEINRLSSLSVASSGDQIPVFSPDNGDARKMSVGTLLTYFQQQFTSPTVSVTISVPLTGFNLPFPSSSSNVQWLLLNPAGTLSSGTILLPLNTATADGTEVLVTSTGAITTLTVSLNGASNVYGAPTTLAANGFFRLRYVRSLNSWFRIG